MGKYMRKTKPQAEVAVMDVTQSSFGVRTRAKTLALQRSSSSAAPAAVAGAAYLQLRSRQLFKPPHLLNDSPRRPNKQQATPNSNSNASSRNRLRGSSRPADSGSRGSGREAEIDDEEKEEEKIEVEEEDDNSKDDDNVAVEASFGENVLDTEARERSTRESTPCSLIRDPDAIRTPGSTNRPTSSMENRVQNLTQRPIPTATEMDEFFAGAEEEQQKQFIEKYNYDPVNDKPLPGRFQWEKVDP
uniref:Cyclin-dependent kinase inhibitor 1 n=1 Tax=Dimocarpus longan TaxID=128017 RepID=A0A8G0VVY8_9ROSI|nr:cyclin-dependent kinase inhibitor 1 [Dimocarpus longan]